MVHSGQPNVEILCGVEGCVSRYKSCKSWNNHLRKRHKVIYETGSCNENDEDDIVDISDSWETEEAGGDFEAEIFDPNSETNCSLAETSEERKKRHARILLTFKEENRLTQTTTQHFVECINYFASDIVNRCKNVFSDQMLEAGVDIAAPDVDDSLKAIERPLAGLETPWNQAVYFREVFNCVVN